VNPQQGGRYKVVTATPSASGRSFADPAKQRRIPGLAHLPAKTGTMRYSESCDELFLAGDIALAAGRCRTESRYVAELIEALRSCRAGRRRWAVMQSIRNERTKAGLSIPDNFEDGVEKAFQRHCADSELFKRRKDMPNGALFHWPLGKAGGVWAVYPDRADTWLRDRS
jgi:hypothetical protein